MNYLKRFLSGLITPNSFKIGLIVVLATSFVAKVYYERVELRRPESSEITTRNSNAGWQDKVTDFVLMIY